MPFNAVLQKDHAPYGTLNSCDLPPPFLYCTFEGHLCCLLCFMSTITHFQLLLRTNLFPDLWFSLQVFLILHLFSSFNEREKNVILVSGLPPV